METLTTLLKLLNYLKGKKTYLAAVAIGVVAGLNAAGIITKELYDQINAVLYPLALAALRSSMPTNKE